MRHSLVRGSPLVMLLLGTLGWAESISVAMLGNSHVFYNDLPTLIRNLAAAAGDSVTVASSTPGGCTLAYPPNAHLVNPASLGLLETGGWDYVVIQEHSQFPVIPILREAFTFPGAMALDSIAHAHTPCATTVLYMTWGHNHEGPFHETYAGYASPEFADFDQMQDSVTATYLRLGATLGAPVAPVGVAWQNAHRGGVPLDLLFDPDEYHAALPGSYLAACVFYAVFFQKSPLGLAFTAGLDPGLATILQAVADTTVMAHLAQWGIDFHLPFEAFTLTWALPPENQVPIAMDARERPQVRLGIALPLGHHVLPGSTSPSSGYRRLPAREGGETRP